MHHLHGYVETYSRAELIKLMGECYAVYQPVVDTRQNKVFYFEVLLRHHEIKTNSIIQACTYHNMWSELFISMMRNVTKACKVIDVPISMNVSPSQVYNSNELFETLGCAVDDGLSLSKLILEVTENEPICDPIKFRESAVILNGMGVKLSLDDFGSGFSSIKTLEVGGFKHVKIDRALISGIHANIHNQDCVNMLIKYCCENNLDLIAEGVECNEDIKYLHSVDINIMQGYAFSKPINAEDLSAYLEVA